MLKKAIFFQIIKIMMIFSLKEGGMRDIIPAITFFLMSKIKKARGTPFENQDGAAAFDTITVFVRHAIVSFTGDSMLKAPLILSHAFGGK